MTASSNALSRSMGRIPLWIIQVILGAILTGGIAWCTWASVSSWKHEVRIGVVETRVDSVQQNITDIKEMQKETNQKLDRLIERRP